ncbi:ATP synthase subunit I [Nocardia nova]|uniref:Putative ATP synthase I n=1 Tax=Nocardia nova SH22a TaxID=1415166 RepID=W5TWF9_9NOCA|nr:ATP synthase subunit I [Nocardia nova]AHH21511.1 putative ATP synthase I [Nocardia nova SH22a]
MSIDKLRLRRAGIMVAAFGVLALAVTGPLDRLLLGVFICIGLGLGWLNAQLTLRSVTRITRSESPNKQLLALTTASRLIVLTVLAIIVAFLTRPDGVGIFFGLALFQVILVLHTVVPEWRGLRQQS